MTRSLALAAGAAPDQRDSHHDHHHLGLRRRVAYVRGLLDKIGVKPDYLTCGKYKSAAKMFMRKGPSPEAAEMQNWLLDSLYESYQKMVAEGRGVKPERVPPVDRRRRVHARAGRAARHHRQHPAPPGLRGRAPQEVRRGREVRQQVRQEAAGRKRRSFLAPGALPVLGEDARGRKEEGDRQGRGRHRLRRRRDLPGKPEPNPFGSGLRGLRL